MEHKQSSFKKSGERNSYSCCFNSRTILWALTVHPQSMEMISFKFRPTWPNISQSLTYQDKAIFSPFLLGTPYGRRPRIVQYLSSLCPTPNTLVRYYAQSINFILFHPLSIPEFQTARQARRIRNKKKKTNFKKNILFVFYGRFDIKGKGNPHTPHLIS